MLMVLLAMKVEAVGASAVQVVEVPWKKSERVYTRQPNPAESIEVTEYEYDC
jgi:hypothetical protein